MKPCKPNQVIAPFGFIMPGATPTIPSFYWDVYSEEQRWKFLCCNLQTLADYANEINDKYNGYDVLIAEMQEAVAEIRELTLERINLLEKNFYYLATGGMHYDPSAGTFHDSMSTARRMLQFTHPSGMTVSEAGTYTVAKVGQYTCADVGLWGRHMIMGLDEFTNTMQEQHGWEVASFEPDDYVRRDEFEAITTEGIEAGEIYGLPKDSTATYAPIMTPYLREGTVDDLAGVQVTWNNHLVTEDYTLPYGEPTANA